MNTSRVNAQAPDHHKKTRIKISSVLKEAVFGFNDGVVSTFAVIAGLTGGVVESRIVLLAALATLAAGAFSMGLGTYLGSKSEKELYENEIKREKYEMENLPEVERQEIREIYALKGFKGKLLDDVVHQITSSKEVWLRTMMVDELGYSHTPPNPVINGVSMSAAFVVGSVIPTFPYFFADSSPSQKSLLNLPLIFIICLGISAAGLLFAGALKTRFTSKNPVVSALETLVIGALAASASYGVGVIIG